MNEPQEHIFIENRHETLKYTTTQIGRGNAVIPERDRQTHSQRLLSKFDEIWNVEDNLRGEREAVSLPTRSGMYLEFKSGENADLIAKSIEDMRQNIRLLNVRTEKNEQGSSVCKATVYIPEGKQSKFLKKINDYALEDTKSGKPKNKDLVNSIEDVELAIIESLWTDKKELIPNQTPRWCEVWLRIEEDNDYDTQIANFHQLIQDKNIGYKGKALHFPERAVFLINANNDILKELINSSDQLAEFRLGQEATGFWSEESNVGQTEWVENLLSRLEIEDSNVKVCVLDSGVNNGHQLISPILEDNDCLTLSPDWGTDDVSQIAGSNGHGTMMCGIVGYGDLQEALESNEQIVLTHKLCSVKILPRTGENEPENWGDYTEQAVYRAETQNSNHNLLFCMAVTSKDGVDRGKPSAWSGMIDAIAFGESDKKRLFIISGGNIRNDDTWKEYPDANKLESIQNPAQSWNALSIGAYTEKIFVDDDVEDYYPIASAKEISPYNSSSYNWQNKWPIKPEVVFEGGNILRKDNNGEFEDFWQHQDLEILTTSKNVQLKQFETFNATSSASAKASWLAAKVAQKYPSLWAESIRGVIVHSASWTDELISQFNIDLGRKKSVLELLRICGYGVPNIDKALNSYENGLTLIAQETIQPFIKENSKYQTNDMHLFDFPWPKEELLALGDTPVKLKITLSYFIEPGPGRIGWKDKYRYQSFGLRFDVNKEGETEDEFKQRINKAVRDEDYENESSGSDTRWVIGKDNRSIGSIHSDIWEGNAADIADCNIIAVYPVIGWWRERHNLKKYNSKARYSLLVSLETPIEDVELYTAITNKIATPITVEI